MRRFLIIVGILTKVMKLLPAGYESVEGRIFRLISQGNVQDLQLTLKHPGINFGFYIGIPGKDRKKQCVANMPFINYALEQKHSDRIGMIEALLQAGATFLPTVLRDEKTRAVLEEISTEQVSRQQEDSELHSFLRGVFIYRKSRSVSDKTKRATERLFTAIRNHKIDTSTESYDPPDLDAIGYEGVTALELARKKLAITYTPSQSALAGLIAKMEAQRASQEK